MTDAPMAPPPVTAEAAVAALKAEIAKLTPDEQLRINYALTDVIPLLLELVEGAEHPWFEKVPVLGSMFENAVDTSEATQEAKILAMLAPTPAT